MPKGYVIFPEAIHDREAMDTYSQAAIPTIVGASANVLVAAQDAEVLEGEWHGNQTVVLEFESVEAAREWYQSEGYQAAVPLRQAAADCNVVILAGFG